MTRDSSPAAVDQRARLRRAVEQRLRARLAQEPVEALAADQAARRGRRRRARRRRGRRAASNAATASPEMPAADDGDAHRVARPASLARAAPSARSASAPMKAGWRADGARAREVDDARLLRPLAIEDVDLLQRLDVLAGEGHRADTTARVPAAASSASTSSV